MSKETSDFNSLPPAEEKGKEEKNEDLGPLLAACILHDIGKSGPADLPAKTRKTIIELFGLETSLQNHQRLNVGDQLKHLILQSQKSGYYPARLAKLADNLKQADVNKEQRVRNFWQKHTQWTFDLLNCFLDKTNPIVFDKYQGARRRGRLKPNEALEDVRKKIADKNFGQDAEIKK